MHVVTWLMMMNLSGVFPYEVMVKSADLTKCKDDETVCVSDVRDCGRPPSASVQTQTLNMSCYYQISQSSMTCELSLGSYTFTEPDISLIFNSKSKVIYCPGLFLPVAVLNITARVRESYMKGTDIRSQPHTVYLYDAVKPSQPVLSVLNSTDDSVVVFWTNTQQQVSSCRLRYRVNSSHVWSKPPDFVPVYQDQKLVYTIKDLLPFTIYTAAVACRGGTWSDWSRDINVRTLDRVPSTSPQVCYRVEKTDSGSVLLHLMWKDLNFHEAGGRVLGYQVTYEPMKKILNVTEVMALLVVEEGDCTVTVKAFNAAGYGPVAHLSVSTQRQKSLPSVTKLWISSFLPVDKGLVLQWKFPSTPSITDVIVLWHSEMHPSTRHTHWATVDAYNTSIVLHDFDPEESYLISVFTVHQQQCGAPQSLPASLQQGALMEADRLKVAAVTKTSVTIKWVWQRKSRPNQVSRYRVMLTKTSHGQKNTQVVSLWPEEQQHTFTNLSPDTEYSLHLLADNDSTNIVSVRTEFDNVTVVVTAATLLLLVITVLIICILSRTVCKSYFFPVISSPRGSTSGQWLTDPNKHQQISSERNILDIKHFQVTEQSVFVVGPNLGQTLSSELQEDGLLQPLGHLFNKLESDYVSETQCDHPNRVVNRLLTSEEREVNISLLPQTHEDNKWFSQVNPHTSHQTTAPCVVHELLADTDSPHVYQITCDAEYLVNSSFPENPDPKRESTQAKSNYLICEADYITNGCFTPETGGEEDGANNIGIAC
ncbi:interleukin-6 receptor subunit beta [Solea solea]|uniref:interleukin-6 receptor subunit beta n=1 Tax=Solea solea TaxID=90069 RepID=UPI00272B842F|nr:interleukin-6 receptor subunit beta [Solea solea]